MLIARCEDSIGANNRGQVVGWAENGVTACHGAIWLSGFPARNRR